MHFSEPRGYLKVNDAQISDHQLALLAGGSTKEVKSLIIELERNGVFSRDPYGTIYNRRMVREGDGTANQEAIENGKKGGNPYIRRGTVPKEQRVRPFKRSDSPAKTRRILERDNGRCHWCNSPLILDWNGHGEMPPNLYHVDHVRAVCDGGTNDEANLVSACAACNHARARASPMSNGAIPTLTVVGVGVTVGTETDTNPDTNAYSARRIATQKLDINFPRSEKPPPAKTRKNSLDRKSQADLEAAKRRNAVPLELSPSLSAIIRAKQ